jgi:acetoacetyl-CoA reductase
MSRIALVTDGMDGLGEAICIKLATLKYQVVTTYSPENSRFKDWLAAMERQGHRFGAYPCDMSDYASAQQCVTRIEQEVGPVDVLVNNATVKTRLDSVFNMSKAVCDGMSERDWGRIINIAAAGAGRHDFTKALELEVARKGVTVNTISPGYIGTKRVSAIPEAVLNTGVIPQIPAGHLGKPEEVAGLVGYFASDEAAFLTGANITIKGAQHMT